MAPRAAVVVAYGILVAAGISLLAALASGFDSPIGRYAEFSAPDFETGRGLPYRLRVIASGAQPVYPILVIAVVGWIPERHLRRVATLTGLFGFAYLGMLLYIYAYDIATKASKRGSLGSVEQVLGSLAGLVLTIAALIWARKTHRRGPAVGDSADPE